MKYLSMSLSDMKLRLGLEFSEPNDTLRWICSMFFSVRGISSDARRAGFVLVTFPFLSATQLVVLLPIYS